MHARGSNVRAWVGPAVACALACACANSPEETTPPAAETPSNDASPPEVVVDAGVETGACEDCELFPSVCREGNFCPVEGLFGTGIDTRVRLNDIDGSSDRDVWVVGSLGTVLHFDGATWQVSRLESEETLSRLVLRPDGEMWAASSLAFVYVREAGAADWRAITPMDTGGAAYSEWSALQAMWSAPGSEWVWLGIDYTYIQLMRARTAGDGIELDPTPSNVYDAFGQRVMALHGVTDDEVWAVGERGSVFRISNATSEPSIQAFNSQTQTTLHDVWALAANDVWAVGAAGTVRRYRGGELAWEVAEGISTKATLRGVWASSASDVWAVGDDATILHFDGVAWSQTAVANLGGNRPALYGVWGTDAEHVWAIGDGVLLALTTSAGNTQ
ncbi:hypothetical protein AKJ09_01771 [Labilithrix luteola]|uniref:Type IV fimbrial biogenesis protein PilY1 n=1 Tax=Labilithrix luteola TaxID=1391654 RepID=A0A0K1PNL5_9BACT|nr:hypothetical protein [Labilithrix luteola]AKU95107.1 hypothetical protein AKJ09_01771 [Labilithrix luteola]